MPSLQTQIRWCARVQWTLAAIVLALATAFYLAGYRPVTGRLADLRRQIEERQRDLMAGRLQTKVLPDVAGEVRRLRERLDHSNKSLPPEPELPQFIRDVTQLSQQAMLKSFTYKLGVPVRREQVSELPIQLSFAGDFANVFAFLRNAEEMPRLTRVRAMSIRTRDRDKSGQVQVTMTMNIYFSSE